MRRQFRTLSMQTTDKHIVNLPIGYWRILGRCYGFTAYTSSRLYDENKIHGIANPTTGNETLSYMREAYPSAYAMSEHLWFVLGDLITDKTAQLPLELREQELDIGVLEAIVAMTEYEYSQWERLGELQPIAFAGNEDMNAIRESVTRHIEQIEMNTDQLSLPFNGILHQWIDAQHAVSYLIGTGRAHDAYGIDTGDDRLAQYIVPLVQYNLRYREMLRNEGVTVVVDSLLEKFPTLYKDMAYRKPLEDALVDLLRQGLGNYSICYKATSDYFIIFDKTYFSIDSILEWAEQPHEEGQPYIYVEKFPKSNDMNEDILNIFFSKTPFPNNFAELININTPIKEHTNSRISESISLDYLPMIYVENDYALLAK